MTYSTEFQILSKDATSEITTQVSKIVLKVNHTESQNLYLWKQSNWQKQFS